MLGLNQSLVDSFAKQQPTPEPSSESLGAPLPARSPPSKLASGVASLVLLLLLCRNANQWLYSKRHSSTSWHSCPFAR